MRFIVILFCALLFGSKFVAPIPLEEKLGPQRAFQSNSWQENVNTAEQHYGSDFTRAHSVNAMTKSAQQFPTGQEFENNRGRQHGKNYDNNILHSLHSLPTISNPVNVAPGGTNEHRKDGFVSRVDSFPNRHQYHPIRVDNQFKPQNWQSHNRFENPTMSAIDNVATAHESPPPVNRQHYQADNSYPKDLHYHPVPRKSENFRYLAHTRPNSETLAGPVNYESYHEALEHSTNIAQSGHNAHVEKVPALSRPHNSHLFENYNQPALNALNKPGSYIVPPESNNNKNIHVAPINTRLNNFHKRYMEHPTIPPVPRYPPVNSGYNGRPLHTFRHMENPIIHPQPNYHVRDAYQPPVPLHAVLDKGGNTGYIQKPINKMEPNSYAPLNTYKVSPVIQNDSPPSNTRNDNDVFLKLTNDDGASGTTANDKKSNIFYDFLEENPNEKVYDFPEGENVKEFLSGKIKKNFVIIYANGTVEYVNHLNTGDDPDYFVVNNDKPLVPSLHVTSNSPLGSKQPISNILNSLPDKTNYFDSSVTSNDNNYHQPPLHVNDAYNSQLVSQPLNDYHDYNSSPEPELKQNQDTTHLPLLESTIFDDNPSHGALDNFNPLLGPLTSHSNNYNRDSERHENRHSPYNSNENNGYSRWQSKLVTHISPTNTHTSTTPASDDAMIQEFLDSLSIKSDKDQLLSDSNYNWPHDKTTTNHDNKYPFSHTHTTMPPSRLHTVISPGIFKSTTSTPDNLEIQKHQDSHSLISDTSSTLPPSKYEESLQERTTPTPSNSDSGDNLKSTPVDQIITISPIELVTDNVKDGSSLTPEDKEPLETESVYGEENLSNTDNVSKSYDTITSLPSNPDNLHNTHSVDNVLTQVTNPVEIKKNNTKSACNNSLENTGDPEKYDDNTAAPINQNDVNTVKATGYNSLELKQSKSGLQIKLNIPNDSGGTLYIKVDAPDGYTGNEDTTSDDTLLVSITRSNSSDTDLITVKNDTDGHDYFNVDHTNSDEVSPTKNLKLDLSNALVVMNGTTDKDYLNQLLSSDSKVNLFIFQMPCQDHAIVEKFKETTIYPNGTCIELFTETRWENKDDPSPVITTMKKIYGGGKCN